VVTDLARATGLAESVEGDGKRLNRVLQLTGFSDPVYAEAFVTVHQYDIVMDVTVLNRTRETLQVGWDAPGGWWVWGRGGRVPSAWGYC
jgi:coatomer subunit beta